MFSNYDYALVNYCFVYFTIKKKIKCKIFYIKKKISKKKIHIFGVIYTFFQVQTAKIGSSIIKATNARGLVTWPATLTTKLLTLATR